MAVAVPPTTLIVLSNPNTPVPGKTMGGNDAGIPLGSLCDSPMPSSPPEGFLWRITSASGRTVSGPGVGGVRANLFFIQPTHGDGGRVFQLNGGDHMGPDQTKQYAGGVGPNPDRAVYVDWQEWTERFPLTPHMELVFAQFLLAGDETYFDVAIEQTPMGPRQSEVWLTNFPFKDEPSIVGTGAPGDQPEVAHLVGTVPTGFEWIPGAWEVNIRTGPTPGTRHARVVAVPPRVGPVSEATVVPLVPISASNPTLLSHTGAIADTDVSNNNSTGSWTPEGTAPEDHLNHVVFPRGFRIPAGYSLYVVEDGLVGDGVVFTGTCLQQPAPVA